MAVLTKRLNCTPSTTALPLAHSPHPSLCPSPYQGLGVPHTSRVAPQMELYPAGASTSTAHSMAWLGFCWSEACTGNDLI